MTTVPPLAERADTMTSKPVVIVAGAGYRTSEPSRSVVSLFSDPSVKVNIGAAVARTLASKGFNLIVVSRTREKAERLAKDLTQQFPERRIIGRSVDILKEDEVAGFAASLDENESYAYVHSAGLSTGSYHLENDNPYLPIESTPTQLPTLEFDAVVRSLLLMIRALLPRLARMGSSRVVVVSSMSGIRSYPLGYSHASAKAGLHAAVRALALELAPRGVLISEVLPGIVDTGLYDNPVVQRAVREIGGYFGWTGEHVPQMTPYAVAEAVALCMTSPAHVLSINMVADGQWPHQGA